MHGTPFAVEPRGAVIVSPDAGRVSTLDRSGATKLASSRNDHRHFG
jgi:hypothetical protein